jgi:MFS family permease
VTETWGAARLAAGRRAWRLTLVGTLVSSLGTGLTLPFLFVYLHGVRHLSLPLAGTIAAVGAVAAFALTPLSGALGDRVGLGRLLVTGLVVQGVGAALLAVPAGAGEAFVAVAFTASGNSLVFPALNGLVAAQLPKEARSRAYALRFGVLNAGIGVGGLISGSVVSLQHPASFQLVYLLDALSTLAFAALVAVGMRHGPGFRGTPARSAPEGEGQAAPPPRGYRTVLGNRPFVGFLLCSFLFSLFGYAQLDGPWAAFATTTVGAEPRAVGIAFAVNTATIVVCQLGVVRLTGRWRRSRLLLVAAALWACAWLVTAVAAAPALRGVPAAIALAVSLGVFGLGETLFSPVAGGLPNDLATDDLRARYNALGSATWSVAGFVGPPMAGLLLGSGTPWLWVIVVTAGMAVAALGALVLGRTLPAAVDRPVVPTA